MLSCISCIELRDPEFTKVSTKNKIRDYLGIFPNMGGGVFPIPKTQNQKKVTLNHPKITQKNKLKFSQNHPKIFILNEGFPKGGGVRHLGKIPK